MAKAVLKSQTIEYHMHDGTKGSAEAIVRVLDELSAGQNKLNTIVDLFDGSWAVRSYWPNVPQYDYSTGKTVREDLEGIYVKPDWVVYIRDGYAATKTYKTFAKKYVDIAVTEL
jgi:hypothetical protein